MYTPSFKTIDMDLFPRRKHFAYFSAMQYPYGGLTVNVDITRLMERVRDEKRPFFLSLLWHVAGAANSVPEFRQRILDGGIIEYDSCPTSHTVAKADGTYCYCQLDCSMPLADFLPYAVLEQEKAKLSGDIDEDVSALLPYLYVTSTPWLTYTAIVHPVPSPADSNPRISWGKYFEQDGRVLIPVSALFNHALIDGIHLSRFYDALTAEV